MLTIYLRFKNHSPLIMDIEDTEVGRKYFNLVKEENFKEPPIFRDVAKYSIGYFDKLVKEANKQLSLDWDFTEYNLPTTVLIHKKIEELVGTNTNGFTSVSEELDNILHELHYCLHEIQKNPNLKRNRIQVEWFNDAGIPLGEFTFKNQVTFGDLRLQNPYVGHGPHKVYMDNDCANISQTCRFHDLIRPGVVVMLEDFKHDFIGTPAYINWFNIHGPEFVKLHGMNKILKYSGQAIIGKVRNLDTLLEVKNATFLEFESLEFE